MNQSQQQGINWAQSQWWHVYPLGALGADTSGQSDQCQRSLRELIPWLDHLRDLGLNGLALGPIFASHLHGYDTLDYYRIDPRLGDEADFDALVDAAKQRGINITLDGVFNHVSKDHPLLADPAAANMFKRNPDGSLAVFEGHDQLVELNHEDERVRAMISEVMLHWLERGIAGWRLDAAYAMDPRHWREILAPVRRKFPHALIEGEVIHGDYPGIIAASGMDTLTQYELWKAIWSSLRDGNMHELAWSLTRHNDFLKTFIPWTFIGNHDVTRIRSQFQKDADSLAEIALVLLATLPGIPAIYYGDELGFTGLKEQRFGGDDAIRQALPKSVPGADARVRLHQLLLGTRRRFPAIATAAISEIKPAGPALSYRVGEGEQTLLVLLNAGTQPAQFLDASGSVIASNHLAVQTHCEGVNLPGYAWAILTPSGN